MTKDLDLYDQKILYELDKDSRIPASQIAKRIRLSKVSVNNRIKRLVEKGIIKNFMTQVNYMMLGYNNYHIYYRLQNISTEKETKFLNFLCSNEFIGYVARIDGNFDVFLVILSKDSEELEERLSQINHKFGEFIKERIILNLLDALYFGRRYLIKVAEKEFSSPILRKKPKKIVTLEEIDHKLISILSLNARLPVTDIMEKLNLSKDVVHYRLKKLIKERIIQKFTIDLNHEAYGNSFFKLLVKLNYKSDETEFIAKIASNNSLIRITKLLGNWDLELDFEVKDNKEFRQILKSIREELGAYIQDYDSIYIYKIDKLNYYPFKENPK